MSYMGDSVRTWYNSQPIFHAWYHLRCFFKNFIFRSEGRQGDYFGGDCLICRKYVLMAERLRIAVYEDGFWQLTNSIHKDCFNRFWMGGKYK